MEQNKKIKEAPIREQTTIRLPHELKKQLQQEADKKGYSFNGLVIEYLRLGLERK